MQYQARREITGADRPLREYLPRSPDGSLLITSRSREAALKLVDQHNIIGVEPMDEANAKALLEKKLGINDEDQDESQDVVELTAILGFIPLAIVQAAAYISDPDWGCSVREYLSEFWKCDGKKIHLLDFVDGQFRRDWETKNSVLMTWQVSFNSIRQSRRSATDLLSLMSFFDCQGIPETLLHNYRLKDAKDTQREDDYNNGSSETDDFLDDILILRRSNSLQYAQAGAARNTKMTGSEWRTREVEAAWQVLFPHAKSALTCKPEDPSSLLEWASVLHKAAWYDWQSGNGAAGEQLSIRAMNIRKKLLGPEHEDTLSSMEIVGLIYMLKGQGEKAEQLFMRVMGKRKEVLGVEHPETLTSMANLASTYWIQGRWKEAEELDVQVMDTRKAVFGKEHPDTLSSISNLASTYMTQGRLKEAEDLHVQALVTRKNMLGTEHPETLSSMANLASIYRDQGQLDKDLNRGMEVIRISLEVLGAEHPETLTNISNLALTYKYQGRWKEAEELNVQVMEISAKVLGDEHPDTLTSMANLASTYCDQGRWDEAEKLEVNVLKTSQRVLGAKHPKTLTSMGNLALTYTNQGRWKEAKELNVQVMEMSKSVMEEEHPNTLVSMANLAFAWKEQGCGVEALNLMKDCVHLRLKILGAEHPDTLSSAAALIKWQT
ncbi:kinesin, putative [Talaromyces stipitatus ATCC 10500]|uniref:Kinesin, putative n=1 Tax=Talaromyces stipitatus (strain ATCC 10500 / CBS 375.48 / QM 6759 / NRRL 1006) TaxID=441959 RepID=B8LXU6_TALSN|nr:kinesin, putative [Talaromyces stipitatus ATCC 10500]EED22761.1 kinesin, putative [Talaromyces stipitatus ATCC 10500]